MRLGMTIKSRRVRAAMIWWILLCPHAALAMTVKQMQALAGTRLLGLRVSTVFRDCGLPADILDSKAVPQNRRKIRWQDVEMSLSPKQWEMIYTRRQDAAAHGSGWINPHSGSVTCLADLPALIVQAKGSVGFLSVKKRADNQGYRTTYRVPRNLYLAHQIIGVTGRWKQGMPVSRILQRYGKPDEILDRAGGIKLYRYWIVVKQKDEMPISVHAVDFEVKNAARMCTQYTVQTSGAQFVQEKHDALMDEWERLYVLD